MRHGLIKSFPPVARTSKRRDRPREQSIGHLYRIGEFDAMLVALDIRQTGAGVPPVPMIGPVGGDSERPIGNSPANDMISPITYVVPMMTARNLSTDQGPDPV